LRQYGFNSVNFLIKAPRLASVLPLLFYGPFSREEFFFQMKYILAAAMLALPVIAQAQTPGDGKYIVMFRAGTSPAERATAVRGTGAALRFNYSIVDAVAIRIPNPNAIAALQRHSSVVNIVPDRAVHAIPAAGSVGQMAKPGAGGGGNNGQVVPEGVKRVGLPAAGNNGAGIGVAVVDTGIDLTNADLAPPADTFSAFGGSCQDDNGHGTHVAGIVAALDNATGTLGVAPAATLYCAKVLDASGSGSDSDVIAGLEWVFNHTAIRVVNMSLGRPGTVDDNPALRAAVQNLYNAGVTVVVAAGNDATVEVAGTVPASYPEVLAVTSTSAVDGTNSCRLFSGVIKADTASYFTTDGAGLGWDATDRWLGGVTISAPGEDRENISAACLISSTGILSTKLGGGTTRLSGTSMASPHVAGVAARMTQKGTSGPEAIRHALRNTAQRPGVAPLNSPTTSYTFDGDREGIAKAP
jgi:subtilisin